MAAGRARARGDFGASEVGQSGWAGRAAVELAVSQPVISKAISELEHALGFRLLE
jgi:DNA-binding transcriptional LysR family regulator